MALAHRPSALKQQNKKHNTLGHRSKGQVLSQNKGRVDVKCITKHNKKELGREQRRHKSQQIRANKREEAIYKKRQLGTNTAPPFLVCILPLNLNINPQKVLQYLADCDESSVFKTSDQGISHLSCSRLKQRFSFVIPPVNDLYAILDTAKVCDTILFVWKIGEELHSSVDALLASLRSQLLPSVVHAVIGEEELSSKKKMRILKDLQLDISARFPGHSRPYYLNRVQDVNLILRQIGSQKQQGIFYRDQRSHMIAEKVYFEGTGSTGTLQLHGFIRRQPMSVNKLLHIPGWGEFQMSQMFAAVDPFPLNLNRKQRKQPEVPEEDEPKLLDVPDPKCQVSLDTTYEVDLKDEEQTWPTNEEIQDAFEEHQLKRKSKLPRGTSDYQATWILSSDEEDDSGDEDERSEEEMEGDDFSLDMAPPPTDGGSEEEGEGEGGDEEDYEDDKTTLTDVGDDYDERMDYKEEMDFYEKMKAAKDDAAYPDEIDTPFDLPARTRFQKYRGLQSFRTSPWNKDEELPLDYQRIIHFRNFYHTKRRIFKEDREGALPGWYVIIHLKDVPRHLYNDHLASRSPLTVYSLLNHEHKMSVLNLVLKSHPLGHLRPIKAKERLVFHIGVRRFSNAPIFSEHSNGNKHKFSRFFHPGQTVVASMFAPVCYPPCPVSVYRERADGAQDLVASGSVLSADPNRIICKRTVLSGHPFKVNRKSAVIRYMFFNTDDIMWFKSVELRTKWGRRGHIKEPLGTHGHMKCQFDGQLKSQDTVLMNLYKRVFPKWRYDPLVSRPPPLFTFARRALTPPEEDPMGGEGEESQPRPKKKRVQFLSAPGSADS